jgi:hypothetical protein
MQPGPLTGKPTAAASGHGSRGPTSSSVERIASRIAMKNVAAAAHTLIVIALKDRRRGFEPASTIRLFFPAHGVRAAGGGEWPIAGSRFGRGELATGSTRARRLAGNRITRAIRLTTRSPANCRWPLGRLRQSAAAARYGAPPCNGYRPDTWRHRMDNGTAIAFGSACSKSAQVVGKVYLPQFAAAQRPADKTGSHRSIGRGNFAFDLRA